MYSTCCFCFWRRYSWRLEGIRIMKKKKKKTTPVQLSSKLTAHLHQLPRPSWGFHRAGQMRYNFWKHYVAVEKISSISYYLMMDDQIRTQKYHEAVYYHQGDVANGRCMETERMSNTSRLPSSTGWFWFFFLESWSILNLLLFYIKYYRLSNRI